jgi:glucan phosphorylase
VAGQDREHDQRRHAAALAQPGQPGAGGLITRHIGRGWLKDLDQLRQLRRWPNDAAFREHFARVKRDNKLRLAQVIRQRLGVKVDPDSCSTCRSSASTNTSGSCSTCCT